MDSQKDFKWLVSNARRAIIYGVLRMNELVSVITFFKSDLWLRKRNRKEERGQHGFF